MTGKATITIAITFPRWRLAIARALIVAACMFGRGDSARLWANIETFIARGARMEFVVG